MLSPQAKDFLYDLLQTPSPSGFEVQVQEKCREYMKDVVDEIYKDVHGNQFYVLNKDAPFRVMLCGHVDEIGLMVNAIDEQGFIRAVAIGGVDIAVLPGQRVVIHAEKGSVYGVIGRKPIHLTPEKERDKAFELHDLWIDIGAKNRKEAEKMVSIADPITLDVPIRELKNNLITARGLDDRIGAFVCLEAVRNLAKQKVKVAVFCVTTVQEEIGLRGAITSAYACEPHTAIAVDVGWATDHPGIDKARYAEIQLGKGPIIDKGPNINPKVFEGIKKVAETNKIPYQLMPAPRATGTDANVIQLSRKGVATGLIGIPNRYMHTPAEIISLSDVENAIKLIKYWILSLTPSTTFIP
ncbi:MAG TPA: M42 family metallopeptidase [Candidatus Hydrogenedens sp.]|nr:M42 family metallopeptidase [Candidatus Hydrogenedens sp.]HOL20273.1 M42 family metallopeptidase [Candidatus Hydrogenedens sp.]HPP58125.1 M42 family metallopeptidase [Candidatus Hydrogenedens sp.]